MADRAPNRLARHARLAAALKELGHALQAVYLDTERAVLVVSRPEPFKDFSLPVVVTEAGLPEPQRSDPAVADKGRPVRPTPARPTLSALARRLLRAHEPRVPAYRAWEVTRVRTPDDLVVIDRAYAELAAAGLMAEGGPAAEVLPGVLRAPFVLTAAAEGLRRTRRRPKG